MDPPVIDQTKLEANPNYDGEELIDMKEVELKLPMKQFIKCMHRISESITGECQDMFKVWQLGDRKNSKLTSHKYKGKWTYIYCQHLNKAMEAFDASNKEIITMQESHRLFVELIKAVIVLKDFMVDKYRLVDDRRTLKTLLGEIEAFQVPAQPVETKLPEPTPHQSGATTGGETSPLGAAQTSGQGATAASHLASAKGSDSSIQVPLLRPTTGMGDNSKGGVRQSGQNGDQTQQDEKTVAGLGQEPSNRTLEGSSSEHRSTGRNQAKSKQNPTGPDKASESEDKSSLKSPMMHLKVNTDMSPTQLKHDVQDSEMDFEPKRLDSAISRKDLVLHDLDASVKKPLRTPNELGTTQSAQFIFNPTAASSPVSGAHNPDRKSVSEKQITNQSSVGIGAPSKFAGNTGLVLNPQKVRAGDKPDEYETSPSNKPGAADPASKKKLQTSASFEGNLETLLAEKKDAHKKRLISYMMEFDSIASTSAPERGRNKNSSLLSECIFI